MKISINSFICATALLIFGAHHAQYMTVNQSPDAGNVSVRNSKLENPEMMDFQNKIKVGGEYMKAFLAAYEAFRNDPNIVTEKKKIENYSLEFSETKDRYFVLFFAKRLPSEMTLKGGETQLGRDVRYIVDKTDYRIVAREFFK